MKIGLMQCFNVNSSIRLTKRFPFDPAFVSALCFKLERAIHALASSCLKTNFTHGLTWMF